MPLPATTPLGAANQLVPSLGDPAEDPRVEAGLRLEQRLQLGTIDLEEARLRAGHAQVDGIPLHPEHPRKRDQVLFGLLLLVRILMRQEPRNAKAINSLLDECDALCSSCPLMS